MPGEPRTFTLERCLGRGGFGEVYLAEMVGSGGLATPVALKLLRRDLAPGGQAMNRLRDEGRILARLDHPHILRVHDLLVLDGRAALVTEFVAGEDLEECLRGGMPLRALLEVVGKVASALAAAWETPSASGEPLHLAHRDVKPSNVRIGRYGEVKLLDFGIARSDEMTREARTQTDTMVGSPPYMAPERFLDARVRLASDVFSLGAVLLEALIGRRAFDLPVTMLAAHAVDPARHDAHVASLLAEARGHGADPDVLALVGQLLAHDPDRRPTAPELVGTCEGLLDELAGPSLAEWCRARAWTDAPPEPGELDGARITAEGTFEQPAPAAPAAAVPARGRRLGLWLGGLSFLSAAALAVLAVLGVAATGVGVAWQQGLLSPPPAPPAAEPVAAAPEPAEPAAPPPPVPREDAPAPKPARAAPKPVAPAPAEPAAPATGRVVIAAPPTDGITLSRGGERRSPPGDFAAGEWAWEATHKGAQLRGTVVVPPGGTVTVACGTRLPNCAVN